MGTAKVDNDITITDEGGFVLPINKTKSFTYTVKEDKEYSILNGATQVLWDTANEASEASSDFDMLAVMSDKDTVYLELVNDVAGGGPDDVAVITLAAGLPFFLGSDKTLVAYSGVDGLASSTQGSWDRIRVKNSSGSTAKVRLLKVS